MRSKIYATIDASCAENKISRFYDRFMLLFILTSLVPLCFKQTNAVFTWIDRITVATFILDYALRWFTADYKIKKRGALPFIVYPFTIYALIDLISILSSFTVINPGFKLFRLLRLNKALKALKLLRYSKSVNLIISVIKKERRALIAVCVLAGGYILLSALIMFQVEPEGFNTFFDAIYWAVVTLTTVGYGDIYPINNIGRVVSMLSSFMGIAIVALPTGIITAGYMNAINNNNE